jgi:hypothetical protein
MNQINVLKAWMARLLLAVLFACGAGQAAAGPVYTVSIDTSTLGGGPAYLGLYFMGLANAAPATATVQFLSGALDGPAALTGDVTGSVPGPFVFGNTNGGGDLVQGITLGGLLSFSVGFELGQPGQNDAGTTFGWALFNDVAYLGADGDLGTIALQPGAAPGGAYTVNNASALSSVVPEPPGLALMLMAGLALAVARSRQRQP